jgi:hypothetical protein
LIHANLQQLVARFVPRRRNNRTTNRPPWMSSDLLRLRRARAKAWKRYRDMDDSETYGKYKLLRNKCKVQTKIARQTYEEDLVRSAKVAPKRIYAYINHRRKDKGQLPGIQQSNGEIITGDQARAELFAQHFSTVDALQETTDPGLILPLQGKDDGKESLSELQCQPAEVERLFLSLNSNKSPGPDGLHPLLFKELASILALPMSNLYNTSLCTGQIPKEWGRGVVRPFPKAINAGKANDYRPICLTSVALKTLERIVKNLWTTTYIPGKFYIRPSTVFRETSPVSQT